MTTEYKCGDPRNGAPEMQSNTPSIGAHTKRMCPNCGRSPVANHPEDACVLGVLIQMIRERGNLSERKLRTVHANCDADALWTRLGPVVDALEDGEFSHD